MLLLFAALQFANPADSPETRAVMDKSRQKAAEQRANEASAAASEAEQKQEAAQGAQPLPIPPEMQKNFQRCLNTAIENPIAGQGFAESWRLDGGGIYARQCLGFSLTRQERWTAAVVAFEQAADEAERSGTPDSAANSARLLAQAGNAALAGNDLAKARADFDGALARGLPDGLEKGEVFLDRARTLVALNELSAARDDLDVAIDMVPQDPLAWLLSATLARRMNALNLAQRHIAQAVKLSPDDASVALEEGNIAILSGTDDVAKLAWQRAVQLSPESDAGKSAAANLATLAGQKTVE